MAGEPVRGRSRSGLRPWWTHASPVLLAAALAVGACEPSPTPTGPAIPAASFVAPATGVPEASSPPPSASPDASSTPAPPPSAAPAADIGFQALVADPDFSATVTLTGSRTLGKVRTATTGTLDVAGDAWHLVRTATTGKARTTLEAMAVDGTRYVRTAGEWFEGDDAAAAGLVAAVLGTGSAITDAGPETIDGEQLHRLSIAAPDPLAASLGLAAPGITGIAGTVDVWVRDDGTPLRGRLAATWTQKVARQRVKGSASMDVVFGGVGEPIAITVPAEPWAWFTSQRYGYVMGYPSTWEPAPGAKGFLDAFYSPGGAQVFANRFKSYGFGLARVVQELRRDPAGMTGFKGVKIRASRSGRLGALPARIVELSGTYNGTRYWWVIYVAVKGPWVHWIEYRTPAQTTDEDRAMAARFAATHRGR